MGRRKEAKDGRSRVDNVLSVSYNVLSVSNNYMSSPCQYIVLSVSNNVLSVSRQGPLRVKTIPLRPVFTRVRAGWSVAIMVSAPRTSMSSSLCAKCNVLSAT